MPFVAENLYQVVKAKTDPESVHLCRFPQADPAFINPLLEEEMAIILKAVNMGRGLRARHQLKIRQPLAKVTLVTKNQALAGVINDMAELIQDELNVKAVAQARNEEDLVHLSAKPNLRNLGPKLGKKLNAAKEAIAALTPHQIVAMQEGASQDLVLEGEAITLTIEDLFLERSEKPGIVTESSGDLTLALDTHLTPELEDEGLVREFVNRVQQTRKEMDLAVTARIHLEVFADAAMGKVLQAGQEYIARETLADHLSLVLQADEAFSQTDLNGRPCAFRLLLVPLPKG